MQHAAKEDTHEDGGSDTRELEETEEGSPISERSRKGDMDDAGMRARRDEGYRARLVGDRYAHGPRKNHDLRVHFREESRPYPPTKERGTYNDGSDHSLSSLSSAGEYMLP